MRRFLRPATPRAARRALPLVATLLLAAAARPLAAQPATALATRPVAPPDVAARLQADLLHERWTERDGAPPIPILALHESRDGFLWVGTEFGLLRFDGAAFARVAPALDRAVGETLVRAIAETPDGTTWISTQGRGVVRWRGGVATVLDTTHGLPDHDVRGLVVDERGTLWAAGGAGLARLDGGRFRRVGAARAPVRDVAVGPDGTLWAATPALTRLRGDSLEPVHVEGLRAGEEAFALHRARDGALWVGTVRGLLRIERIERATPVSAATDAAAGARWRVGARYGGHDATYVRAVGEDAHGRIWASTSGGGVIVVANGAAHRFRANEGLTDDDVQTVHVGRTGAVWAGTRSGVDRFRPRAVRSVTALHGVRPHFLWSVAADADGVWLATNGGGIYHRARDGRVSRVTTPLPSDIVYGVMPTADSTLWVRSGAGLSRFRAGRPVDIPALSPAERARGRAAFVDRDGALWLGGGFGAARVHEGRVERLAPGTHAPSRPTEVFAQTADGTVWMEGGDLVGYHDGRLRRLGPADGVDAVTSLAADGDDLWVGTYDDGVLLVRGGRVHAFADLDVPRRVYGVAIDRVDGLWLSTNAGLRRVSRAALRARTAGSPAPVAVRGFDQRDGLWNVEFNVAGQNPATLDADGRLWFASAHGAVWVDPARLPPVLPPPTPLIETVLHDGLPYPSPDGADDDGARLRGRGVLEMRFAAPALDGGGRVAYRHRLVGYDTGWVNVGARRVALYTGVPGGQYRFEVQASRGDGTWSAAAAVPVALRPHLLERADVRALAAALAVAALVGASALVGRHRTRRLRTRADELAALVDDRTRALQELNEELERRVVERTAQLRAENAERLRLQDDLQQAQKLDSIGRLAGGIAHDLNNMLTAILAFAEFAEGASTDDEQRADLQEVRAAGRRASNLTQQLLAFARRQVIDPRVLDLRAVVTGLGALLRRLLGTHVEVTIAAPDDLWAVRADPSQVEQILVNLAVNARDAMPDGGRLAIELANGRVDGALATRLAIPPGEYVRLTVADTGTGMTPEVRRRLFEPFFTTKAPGMGTGLGLATSYGIATQAGGGIDVSSEPGLGTRFDVWLPRTLEPLAAAPAGGDAALPPGTETVLLVDDEEPVRAAARRVLTRCGYRVVEASGGEDALDVASRLDAPPALLLCDVVMPRLGGPELAERLRARWPGLRVLLMTGYAERTLHGEDPPFGAMLRKPFTPAGLAQRVRDALDLPVDLPVAADHR